MKRKMKQVVMMMLLLGFAASFAGAGTAYFETEFLDAEGYSGTDINGQNGWSVLRVGTAPLETVSNRTDGVLTMTPTYAGSVAYSVAKHATNVADETSFTVRTSMQYTGTAGAYAAFYLEQTGDTAAGNRPKVEARAGGFLYYNNGTPVTLIPPGDWLAANTWYDVEFAIDLVSKTYNLSVTPNIAGASTLTANNIGFSSAFTTFGTVVVGGGHYNTDATQPYNAAVFDYVEVVPEPATMALLACGGLMALRRRKK